MPNKMSLLIDDLIIYWPENSADLEDDSTVWKDHNDGRKDENNKQLKKLVVYNIDFVVKKRLKDLDELNLIIILIKVVWFKAQANF